MTVEVIGKSSLGRDMYGVVINRLRSWDEKRGYLNWLAVRATMLESPILAQKLLRRMGDDVKVPILVQGGIHGNEYEGVDSNIDMIEKFATTPYGDRSRGRRDPQQHDPRLQRDPEPGRPRLRHARERQRVRPQPRLHDAVAARDARLASSWMKRWLAPEMLDLHGYVTPTLIEATTKPHNPSIEYDMWLKWNQPRIDYNEAALAEIGQEVTRPINEWCPEADEAGPDGICDDGSTPGPDVAEGWDDWGPFYAPMYHQHIGLDSSTVEMCSEHRQSCGGARRRRARSRTSSRSRRSSTSSANRDEMLARRARDLPPR